MLSRYGSQDTVPYFGSRSGFGINRNTWRAGQTVGRALKRWMSKPRAEREHRKSLARAKPKILKGVVENDGTGGQLSKFSRPARKSYIPKSVIDSVGHSIYTVNNAGQLLSPVGLQAAGVLGAMCTKSDYDNISATSSKDRYYLESVRMEVDMVNCYQANTSLCIYDIVARRDVASSSITNPLDAWLAGDNDEGVAADYTYAGSTPFQTDAFNTYFKVLNVTQVTLGGGNMHKHIVTAHPAQLLEGAYAHYTTYGYRDLSQWVMVVISGQPANDTVTSTQVTLGKGGINFVTRKEHRWRVLQSKTPVVAANNALLAAFTTNEQVVDTGGSTIGTNTFG